MRSRQRGVDDELRCVRTIVRPGGDVREWVVSMRERARLLRRGDLLQRRMRRYTHESVSLRRLRAPL
jgi:hypothetical protein